MQLLRLFASPLGVVNFGELSRDMNKKLIAAIDNELDKRDNRDNRSFRGDSVSTVNNLLFYKCFQDLNGLVTHSARTLMRQYGYQEEALEYIYTDYYWGNRASKGGWSRPHYHGDGKILWSGVYYPHGYEDPDSNLDEFNMDDWILTGATAPEDTGGFLCIQDSSFGQKGVVTPNDPDILLIHPNFYMRRWVKPREGLLILFPCWQEHFVEPVTRDENRYSISFSIKLDNNFYRRVEF